MKAKQITMRIIDLIMTGNLVVILHRCHTKRQHLTLDIYTHLQNKSNRYAFDIQTGLSVCSE